MDLRHKKVTVVGFARSGIGAANLLAKIGCDVTITDRKSEPELAGAAEGLSPAVKRVLGGHPQALFDTDFVVISPGVPLEMPQLAEARSRGVALIGELELAYQILQEWTRPEGNTGNHPAGLPFLAVTGSNGKSTTVTLLNEMMRNAGFRTIFGGNIGNALTDEVMRAARFDNGNAEVSGRDCAVVEVSSFQLESISDFRPTVAAILNITPDHLDRYPSFEAYAEAKARIFLNQRGGDSIVLNGDDPETVNLGKRLELRNEKPRILYFSRVERVNGMYMEDGMIYCNSSDSALPGPHVPFIRADEIRIKGVHNLENAMAASAMALLAHCPPEAVIKTLREFPGLEHRLEFVRELDGVKYFNDSKGTNTGAVLKSLESFREPLILIAGGRDKAGDFTVLREPVSKRVKRLVLIGEAADKIRASLDGCTDAVIAKDLRDAVRLSREMAEAGDTVLLSPACASFDMFLDFEDRGRQFKKIVMELGRNE